LNVTSLWEKAASVAFGGKDGALDEAKCVRGSVTSKEQQTGTGPGNANANGTASGKEDKKDAAAGLTPGWMVMVLCSIVVFSSLGLT
jgi:hypothetical protein